MATELCHTGGREDGSLRKSGAQTCGAGLSSDDALAGPAFFSQLRAPCRFIIVRHGESEANALKIIQGHSDYPLDSIGRQQAAEAADWLKDQNIQRIFSSPLSRAVETARTIARAVVHTADGKFRPEIEPVCLEDLIELDTGCFSGISLEEAERRFPREFAGFEAHSWEGVPDAERETELYARAMRIWTRLREEANRMLAAGQSAAVSDRADRGTIDSAMPAEREPDGITGGDVAVNRGSPSVVAVSHGGFIQWLLRTTFGCRNWMPLIPTGNCGIFELVVEPRPAAGSAYMLWKRINFQVNPVDAKALF